MIFFTIISMTVSAALVSSQLLLSFVVIFPITEIAVRTGVNSSFIRVKSCLNTVFWVARSAFNLAFSSISSLYELIGLVIKFPYDDIPKQGQYRFFACQNYNQED